MGNDFKKAGGVRGGKARLESDQMSAKACVSRRLRRAAADFRTASGPKTETRDIGQAVEKVEHSWAFSYLYGKISMGDERCLNEGSWIVES